MIRNADDFVEALRIAVRDAAVTQTIGYIANPPGRRVPGDLKKLSEWYGNLSSDERATFSLALEKVADSVMFGILCVLDGIIAIEDGPNKGYLELQYVKDESSFVLNAKSGPLLHEIY